MGPLPSNCYVGERTIELVNLAKFLSIGVRSSYRVGACRIIPAVPANTASEKIHRNNRSRTIATNFQSSFT